MEQWKHGKLVIGLVGGIGSGKSFVAGLFAREGCAVIDSDRLAHDILQSGEVKEELRQWLGAGVINTDGSVSRRAVAREVFGDAEKAKRLNGMIHPRVAAQREELMKKYVADAGVKAIVWDSPLLIEAGLTGECDAIVFVKVPSDIRLRRIRESRGWEAGEVEKREKLQIPLDKKAQVADYCIDNSGDEATSLRQIQRVLSHLSAASR